MRLRSFHEVYERDKKLVLSIPLGIIQKALAIIVIFFSTLNFLDILTTLYNLNYVEGAFEVNIFLGSLLYGGPLAIFAAVFLKIEIVAILLLIYFIAPRGRYELANKVVKLGTIAGLFAVTPIYIWGVLLNNFPILIQSLIS